MKAVIHGAGIAGLALAARLARAGWEVTLLEPAQALQDEGYVVDLFGSGFEAATRMGLLPALRRSAYLFDAIRWVDDAGRTQARLPLRVLMDVFEGRLLSLLRGDLQRALLEQLPDTVRFRFGRMVTQVRAPVGAVEVSLNTGEVERGDVLIGADGIRSRIRELVFGDGSSWFRFLGLHTAACIIDTPDLNEALGNELHIVSVPKRQVGLYPLREGKVAVSFIHRAPQAGPPRSIADALMEAYGDLDWHVPKVLRQARRAPDIVYEHVGQVVMAHWSRGRIALLGDACQAVSLMPGQGASLSLAAAFVLAEELTNGTSDVKAALSRYEHRVRPELIQMRRSGRRAADWLVPSSSAALVARNALIRLVSRTGLSRLLWPAMEAAKENVLPPSKPASASHYG